MPVVFSKPTKNMNNRSRYLVRSSKHCRHINRYMTWTRRCVPATDYFVLVLGTHLPKNQEKFLSIMILLMGFFGSPIEIQKGSNRWWPAYQLHLCKYQLWICPSSFSIIPFRSYPHVYIPPVSLVKCSLSYESNYRENMCIDQRRVTFLSMNVQWTALTCSARPNLYAHLSND